MGQVGVYCVVGMVPAGGGVSAAGGLAGTGPESTPGSAESTALAAAKHAPKPLAKPAVRRTTI